MLAVQELLPDHRLRPFLFSYVQRESHPQEAEVVEPVLARLGAVLEFQFAGPYEVPIYGTDISLTSLPVTVVGPITYRRARIIIRGHVQALTVLFQPMGFHALFGVPTSPLSDFGYEAHGVLGASVSILYQRLGNTASFAERASLLDSFFIDQIARMRPLYGAAHVLQQLSLPGRKLPLSAAARQAGISTRQLERLSLQHVGMSPTMIVRIARFRTALRLKLLGAHSWTEVAHTTGYHDHMHMVRDFHALAGDTPSAAFRTLAPDQLTYLAAMSRR